jgi:hypothetical protein
MSNATANALVEIVHQIITSAEQQRRELTDFEAGRVDALLDVASVLRTTERTGDIERRN